LPDEQAEIQIAIPIPKMIFVVCMLLFFSLCIYLVSYTYSCYQLMLIKVSDCGRFPVKA